MDNPRQPVAQDEFEWTTPEPTIDLGWTVRGTLAATERGAVVESLHIEPSEFVRDQETGELRPRRDYETPSGGITWKVLNLISLDDLRSQQIDILEDHLHQIAADIERLGPETERGQQLARIKEKWQDQLAATRPTKAGGRPPCR